MSHPSQDPSANTQRSSLYEARRIVLKLGTQVVLDAEGRPALSRLYGLMEMVAELRRRGAQPLLVSSGAVGCSFGPSEAIVFLRRPKPSLELGKSKLGLSTTPSWLRTQQVCLNLLTSMPT